MEKKYILLIAWYVGMILFVGNLYLKDTNFQHKKLCTYGCIISGAIVIVALICIIVMFVLSLKAR